MEAALVSHFCVCAQGHMKKGNNPMEPATWVG